MTSRKDEDSAERDTPADTGHDDSTNIVKRLRDNQPLSDTHELRDERLGEHRQYRMRDVGSVPSENESPATRGSDDQPERE
jgi:hypothetical protein